MKLDPKEYDKMVRRASPPSPVVQDCLWAFFVGGAICLLGEALRQLFLLWYDKTMAGTLTSIALIFLSALATLPGWYQKGRGLGYRRGGQNFYHRGAGHCLWHAGVLCVGRGVLAGGKGGLICRNDARMSSFLMHRR